MTENIEKRLIGPVIRLHPRDNVVVARVDVPIGTPVPGESFTSRSQVPAGHKIAAREILKGEPILKYNVTIGFAAADIAPGTLVHRHNMEFREFDRDYAYAQRIQAGADAAGSGARDLHGLSCARTGRSARATTSASCPR